MNVEFVALRVRKSKKPHGATCSPLLEHGNFEEDLRHNADEYVAADLNDSRELTFADS